VISDLSVAIGAQYIKKQGQQLEENEFPKYTLLLQIYDLFGRTQIDKLSKRRSTQKPIVRFESGILGEKPEVLKGAFCVCKSS
jgi:hypothetical protein